MAKVVLKVHFMDDSFKTVAVPPGMTAQELLDHVSEKIEVEDTEGFCLFVRRVSDPVGERFLEPDEEPVKNMVWDMKGVEADVQEFVLPAQWGGIRKEWEGHFRYILKRRMFMKDQVVSAQTPVVVNLLYVQAVSDVVSGTYPCSQEDAVFLAGLQCQVNFGDHDEAKHTRGFLAKKINDYIPIPFVPLRSADEWEADVFAEHAQLREMVAVDAQLQYLQHVRKWYFYGSLFWQVKVHNAATVSLPNEVVLAVNCEGIHVLKVETKELISSHSFTDVYSWAYKVNAFAFVSGSITRQKYQFETEYGKDIAKTLQAYVDVLLARHKAQQQKQKVET